ncbi:MAG: biotin/lipoyl-containing protein [Polyangiales bacterium]
MSVEAKVVAREDGTLALVAPKPAYWRDAPKKGAMIVPGASIGRLEVLGALEAFVAPKTAAGRVVEVYEPKLGRRPVDAATVILVLDPNALGAGVEIVSASTSRAAEGLVFRAPMSGRLYHRPSPNDPAFVTVGQTIRTGETVGLLEVMKTFNRVTFGGDDLPASAKVKAIVAEDGADLEAGDVILVLEE